MESQAHASEMGDPIIADELGEEYSLWVATAQIQLLSTVTHEPDHMKKYMGMGGTAQAEHAPGCDQTTSGVHALRPGTQCVVPCP